MKLPAEDALAWLPALQALGWSSFAFLCGSLPFSVWVGKALAGRDIRQVGDGNPGATNVLRAGGVRLGVLAYGLDFMKAALPVGLAAYVFDLKGLPLWMVAVAPTLGHGFSPFLRGRGGKALATMLGAWIGLSKGEVALVAIGLLLLWFALLAVDGWAVLMTGLGVLAYTLVMHPDPVWIATAAFQVVFVIWKHSHDLAKKPMLRSWLRRQLSP